MNLCMATHFLRYHHSTLTFNRLKTILDEQAATDSVISVSNHSNKEKFEQMDRNPTRKDESHKRNLAQPSNNDETTDQMVKKSRSKVKTISTNSHSSLSSTCIKCQEEAFGLMVACSVEGCMSKYHISCIPFPQNHLPHDHECNSNRDSGKTDHHNVNGESDNNNNNNNDDNDIENDNDSKKKETRMENIVCHLH